MQSYNSPQGTGLRITAYIFDALLYCQTTEEFPWNFCVAFMRSEMMLWILELLALLFSICSSNLGCQNFPPSVPNPWYEFSDVAIEYASMKKIGRILSFLFCSTGRRDLTKSHRWCITLLHHYVSTESASALQVSDGFRTYQNNCTCATLKYLKPQLKHVEAAYLESETVSYGGSEAWQVGATVSRCMGRWIGSGGKDVGQELAGVLGESISSVGSSLTATWFYRKVSAPPILDQVKPFPSIFGQVELERGSLAFYGQTKASCGVIMRRIWRFLQGWPLLFIVFLSMSVNENNTLVADGDFTFCTLNLSPNIRVMFRFRPYSSLNIFLPL